MKTEEYGRENEKTAVLLHGGGLGPWSCREAARLLAADFHVVVPTLDGHAGSGRPFLSIEDSAQNLAAYIDSRFGGRVFLICGLSLGGQILTELLTRRGDICAFAVIESALVVPMPLTRALIFPALALSYPLVKKPWFARAQFASLGLKPSLYGDYYRDSCAIAKGDMAAFLRANTGYCLKDGFGKTRAAVCILAGGRERRKIRAGARALHRALPGSTLVLFKGWRHGDAGINHPEEYAGTVRAFIAHESAGAAG